MSFLSPKKPTVPKVSKVPTAGNSAEELAAAAEADKQRRKTQRGRAATVLTSNRGVLGDDEGGLATKQLLGK